MLKTIFWAKNRLFGTINFPNITDELNKFFVHPSYSAQQIFIPTLLFRDHVMQDKKNLPIIGVLVFTVFLLYQHLSFDINFSIEGILQRVEKILS